ncbi:hypothetical protein [Streptomyces sp. SA15]|uniref:hypothetical protein n=1 Tax=Streptomyces sp. SA15 TaxID=934019 RepID=UPI0015CE1860|nr:hypothetical protein [Streptomyces sp. SA15]
MITGYVIGESLRVGAEFQPSGLRLRKAGRAEAIAYGRSVGTPEHQLDWAE